MSAEETLRMSWLPAGKRWLILFDSSSCGSSDEKKKCSSTRGVKSTNADTRPTRMTVVAIANQSAHVRPALVELAFTAQSGCIRHAMHRFTVELDACSSRRSLVTIGVDEPGQLARYSLPVRSEEHTSE